MFSCRTRGFCPSCHAKRLEEWGEWMRETLLLDVPHRQVVFTIPRRLRVFFKYKGRLLSPQPGPGHDQAGGRADGPIHDPAAPGPGAPLLLGEGGPGRLPMGPGSHRTGDDGLPGVHRPGDLPHPRQRANIFHDLFSERGKVRLNSAATGPADGSRVARPRSPGVLDVPRALRLCFLTIVGWVNGNKDVPNIPPRPAQPKRKLLSLFPGSTGDFSVQTPLYLLTIKHVLDKVKAVRRGS